MMPRIGRLVRCSTRRNSESRSLATVAGILVMVLGLGLTAPPNCLAEKLSSFLTPQDLARPLLLDQNGQQLQLPRAGLDHPAYPHGSIPTYLVIPTSGGEHLPAGTSTIFTGQGGPAVGPLDWTAIVKAKVDAAIATSGLVAVDTPHQNYVVEYLPRLSRSLAGSTTGVSSTPPVQSTTTGSSTTPSKSPTVPSTSTSNELSQFFGGNLSSFGQLAKNTMSDVKNLLHIDSSKPTTTKPSLNLEAQVIDPPLPAPIPEPGTWMVFAVLAAAAGLRVRRSGIARCVQNGDAG